MSPAAKTKTADQPTFNTFTKSYKIRYVVHASRVEDKLTICGRGIDNRSKAPFDSDVDGACRKCVQKLEIEQRIHPGWEG
jgi:hypothetical protein